MECKLIKFTWNVSEIYWIQGKQKEEKTVFLDHSMIWTLIMLKELHQVMFLCLLSTPPHLHLNQNGSKLSLMKVGFQFLMVLKKIKILVSGIRILIKSIFLKLKIKGMSSIFIWEDWQKLWVCLSNTLMKMLKKMRNKKKKLSIKSSVLDLFRWSIKIVTEIRRKKFNGFWRQLIMKLAKCSKKESSFKW